MASVIVAGDVSGTCTLQAPSAAGSTVLTLPVIATDTLAGIAATQTLTNKTLTSPTITGATITVAATAAPAFSAYLGSNQSITTGTYTKVQCNTEEFDTNSNYDNATNYRFTPTVAGYYQVNGRLSSSVNTTLLIATIYKNGVDFKRGMDIRASVTASTSCNASALIYMNGTTDYIELYAYILGTTPSVESGAIFNYFQASMVRSA